MVSVDFECCGFCLSPDYANQITLISSGNWNFKMYIEEHPIISLSEEEGTVFINTTACSVPNYRVRPTAIRKN